MKHKKVFYITANIKGSFYIEAKTKEEAESKFERMITQPDFYPDKKKLGLKHFSIERINKKQVIDEIPF